MLSRPAASASVLAARAPRPKGAVRAALGGLAAFLAFATPARAAATPGYLEFIGATARPGSAEVTIALSKPAPYVVKTLPADAANPYRVYIDFDETKLGPGAFKERPLTSGPVLRIRTGQFTPTQARVVIDLKEQLAHTVVVQHKPFRIVLKIGDPGTAKARREKKTFAAVLPPPTRQNPWPPPVNVERPFRAEPQQLAKVAPPLPANRDDDAPPPPPARPAPPPQKEAAARPAPTQPIAKPSPPAAAAPTASAPASGATAPSVTAPGPSGAGRVSGESTEQPVAKEPPKPGAIAAGPPFSEPLRVVIDPGHGGRDPGAQSVDGAWEKDIVLGLSQFLADRVRSRLGLAVELTRHGDETVPIHVRAEQAAGAELLVSVHANAHPKPWVQGVQTFFYVGTGQPGGESRRLAQLVHRRVVSAIGLEYGPVGDGGVRERDLGLLRMSSAPSLLLEAAYLSNPADRRRLDDPVYRMAVTDGVIDGIADFLTGLPAPRKPLIARILHTPERPLFPIRPDLPS